MLEILGIYFVFRKYSELSKKHKKNPWGFAILGVLIYLVACYGSLFAIPSFFDFNDNLGARFFLVIISIGIGVVSTYVFYLILKASWENEDRFIHEDVIDDNYL